MRILFTTLLLFLGLTARAAISVYDFSNPEDEARFRHLSEELRCLVCQNQNLADSNAELARDLRNKLYDMVRQGRSDEQIIDYMVQRYGDFVLYKPPARASTYALWFGPLVLLVIGLAILLRFIRQRARQPETTLDDEEQARLAALLETRDKDHDNP